MVATLDIDIPQWALDFADKKSIKKAIRGAGQEVAAVARNLIQNSKGSGPHGASLPGEPPASQTGELAASIKSKILRGGMGVSVRDMAPYALYLEEGAYGGGGKKGSGTTKRSHTKRTPLERHTAALARGETRVLLPRPFLSRALEEREASISSRVRAAIMDDVAFKRIRP